jgi:hypothetical protein
MKITPDIAQQYIAIDGLLDFVKQLDPEDERREKVLQEVEERSGYIHQYHVAVRSGKKLITTTITIESQMNP